MNGPTLPSEVRPLWCDKFDRRLALLGVDGEGEERDDVVDVGGGVGQEVVVVDRQE